MVRFLRRGDGSLFGDFFAGISNFAALKLWFNT